MDENSKALLLAEHSTLRTEVHSLISQISADQRNALIMSGAIWAWLATNEATSIFGLVKWAPAVLTLFFAFKRVALSLAIHQHGGYIEKIEANLRGSQDIGWQHYLKEKRNYGLRYWSIIYWAGLFAANILLASLATPTPNP